MDPDRAVDLVQATLHNLANDDNFQQSLRLDKVKLAIKHWTGAARLPPARADDLMRDELVSKKVSPAICRL
jgi:hypothetical protein